MVASSGQRPFVSSSKRDRQLFRIVAERIVLADDVPGDDADRRIEAVEESGKNGSIGRSGPMASAEAVLLLIRTASSTPGPSCSVDDAEVIEGGEVVRFARLGGDVHDVDLRRRRGAHRAGDVRHQQIRHDAGVEAAGTEDDQIGVEDRADRRPVGGRVARNEVDALDRRLLVLDVRFAPITVPSTSSASRRTFSTVEGRTRPRMLSTLADSMTACSKLPVTLVSAVMKRLPSEWPLSSEPAWLKRYWKRRETSDSSSARATRQLRMSPGAGMS